MFQNVPSLKEDESSKMPRFLQYVGATIVAYHCMMGEQSVVLKCEQYHVCHKRPRLWCFETCFKKKHKINVMV
jgi:hypothetical protein